MVNYDFSTSNNDSYTDADGFGFVSSDKGENNSNRHDVAITYQKRFDDVDKKLDFKFNYNNNNNDFDLLSRLYGTTTLNNTGNQNFYQFKTDYSQEIKFLDETKFSAGVLADRLDFTAESFDVENLDYFRNTLAAYTEFQSTYKKFDFILGGRLESYKIEGNTDTADLLPFDKTQFFPNATVQYNLMTQVYLKANYNKKISLPSSSSLNPNNTNYQNPNVSFTGNPNLDPTIYDTYEVRVSAFDYCFIGYSISDASNRVVGRILQNTTDRGALMTQLNVSSSKIYNFDFGLPLPYMLFSKGLKETMKFDFNPDEINFLYLYVGNQKHVFPDVDAKSFWLFNIMSQIQLPSKIKFTATYNTSTTGGNYQYYGIKDPFSQEFDVNFSKKFLNDNLSVTLYVNDIFNTNQQGLTAIGTDLQYFSKNDSRRVGFSLNYKIPTKNKLAKEDSNYLNQNKKEEGGIIGN